MPLLDDQATAAGSHQTTEVLHSTAARPEAGLASVSSVIIFKSYFLSPKATVSKHFFKY